MAVQKHAAASSSRSAKIYRYCIWNAVPSGPRFSFGPWLKDMRGYPCGRGVRDALGRGGAIPVSARAVVIQASPAMRIIASSDHAPGRRGLQRAREGLARPSAIRARRSRKGQAPWSGLGRFLSAVVLLTASLILVFCFAFWESGFGRVWSAFAGFAGVLGMFGAWWVLRGGWGVR